MEHSQISSDEWKPMETSLGAVSPQTSHGEKNGGGENGPASDALQSSGGCRTPETTPGPPFYQSPPGYSAAQEARARRRAHLVAPMLDSFPFFAGLSLSFGILFPFCLYKNPCGVTYPLFAAFACLCGILSCKKLGVPMKKGSWFVLAAAVLMGIPACRTADLFLIRLNGAVLVLLGCIFAIHQFYDDRTWNLGKYVCSIILYLCHALGSIAFPFRHMKHYLKNQDNRLVKQLPLLFGGFLAALPVLALITALLGAADAIFFDLMSRIFQGILRPATLFGLMLRTLFAALSLYCLICSCLLRRLSEESSRSPKGSPAAVAAGLSMIALVYVLFSVIQIVYLFLGKGTLPAGYTYSGYARQGFFQLLLVAFLNLVMVLCCLKYIRPHQAVKALLTLICGCTYILIASACWRMILYVREYHLSYLRLLVLWFLAMLAALMAGVTWLIWNRKFPLFRYSLAVVSAFWLTLIWARPDSVIGWDYVSHLQGETFSRKDFYYLYNLSADAAPALAHLVQTKKADDTFSAPEEVWNTLDSYYAVHARASYKNLGLRNYNFSFARAKKLFAGH